jgi:hypothetical protein
MNAPVISKNTIAANRLIQLKNGQWIDPHEICGIVTIRDSDSRCAVIVNTYAGWRVRISMFADLDEANAYRDHIAELANNRHTQPKSSS